LVSLLHAKVFGVNGPARTYPAGISFSKTACCVIVDLLVASGKKRSSQSGGWVDGLGKACPELLQTGCKADAAARFPKSTARVYEEPNSEDNGFVAKP
jgi:hypothetical protein